MGAFEALFGYSLRVIMKYIIIFLLLITGVTPALSQEIKTGKIEVVGPASIDFGKYPAAEKKVAAYKIRNAGNDVLRIINVRKTCGCASATCSKKELQPKEEAEVAVVILPDSIFGLYSKNTFVESSDPNNRFQCLTVGGNAIPLVDIKPQNEVNAGRILTNKTWIQSFELTGTDPSLKLGTPLVESNYKIETAFTNTVQTQVKYRLDVTLLPADKSGDLACSIKIPVLFPPNRPPIKISISGRIGLELSAIPGIVYLPVSDQESARSISLRLLGQRTRVLDPNTLKLPEHKDIKFEVRQDADGKGLVVNAKFSHEFTKQLFADEKIPLLFEIPGASSAQVVCKTRR
ncbi:MAG: hypothetical protein A2283_22025 [Lentisphaerae bacterium RIFOXYA12_FULL_48_11]|nr:MAG: hypothetical protein A2283_22025 [Lentisphaerae bacterium RIFOXYA12_FULL_48_11]